MAITLTLRQGGGASSTTKDYTSQLRIFAVGESGSTIFAPSNMCSDGSCSQWQFVVDDDENLIPTQGTNQIAAHNLVTVIEDAPGFDAWIGRGRVAYKQVQRADKETDIPVQWIATLDDANTHLKGLALTEDWVRPAESGRTRFLAAAADFLAGSPRLTTDLSTHLVAAGGEVTMPAKTYQAGTELHEILIDCSEVEGKIYAVVIHHDASVSHECLLYIDEADHSTYPSTISITDNSPNLTTSFPPIWDQGAAADHEGQELATGIVSRYGASGATYVVTQDSAQIDAYDYWMVPFNDDLSQTVSQAQARAEAIRDSRKTERVTHSVTIKIPADKIHLVEAGMSIQIRSAASMGGQYLNTTQTRRIAQAKKEPVSPESGGVVSQYLVHMELDRPIKRLPERKGTPPIFNPPCEDFAPVGLVAKGSTNAGVNLVSDYPGFSGHNEERLEITTPRSIAAGHSLIAVVGTNIDGGQVGTKPRQVYDEQGNTWTRDVSSPDTGSDNNIADIWHCNVTNPLNAGDYIRYAVDLGSSLVSSTEIGVRSIGVYEFTGPVSDAVAGTEAAAFSSSPAIGSSGTGGLVFVAADTDHGTSATADSDWTFAFGQDAATGDRDLVAAFLINGANQSYTQPYSGGNTDWTITSVAYSTQSGDCEEPSPIGGGGSSDGGDSDAAARLDHVHEHGDITTGGPYHMAEDVTYDNTGSGLTADDVQEAIDELAGDVGSQWNTPITAALSNPPTQGEFDTAIGDTPDNKAGEFFIVFDNDTDRSYAVTGSSTRGWIYWPGIAAVGTISGGGGSSGGGGADSAGTLEEVTSAPAGGWEQVQ